MHFGGPGPLAVLAGTRLPVHYLGDLVVAKSRPGSCSCPELSLLATAVTVSFSSLPITPDQVTAETLCHLHALLTFVIVVGIRFVGNERFAEPLVVLRPIRPGVRLPDHPPG